MADNVQTTPISSADLVAGTAFGGATILQLKSGIAWRQYLKRASFRSAQFYVDTGVREGGRRIVGHEFPKRDVPYAEDMGRRAREFTVRGYLIVYPQTSTAGNNRNRFPDDPLKRASYLKARDVLIEALEVEGPANLQLPLLGIMNVACQRYRVTEEDKVGGYCVFDMTFVEYGQAPATGTRQSAAGVFYAADNLAAVTATAINTGVRTAGMGAIRP